MDEAEDDMLESKQFVSLVCRSQRHSASSYMHDAVVRYRK